MPKILLTGATGLIGSASAKYLQARGHEVLPLQRSSGARSDQPSWNPDEGRISLPCGSIDAVIHVAGETIAQRWTSAARGRIRASRIEGTRLLSQALADLPGLRRPRVLISASAIGVYGDRGDELLDEHSGPGTGFLAEVAQRWEEAAVPAARAGIRVVPLRFGVVLGAGGALAKMLPVFRLGLGGRLGNGQQWWSWVTLEDVVRAIEFCLNCDTVSGPVNVVAPAPVRNEEFTSALAGLLRRPAFCAVPRWAIGVALGEMGTATLLASTRVVPLALQRAGFVFQYASIQEALAEAVPGAKSHGYPRGGLDDTAGCA